jgi:hypothetical protein
MTVGSKREVMSGKASKTSGGVTAEGLKRTSKGRIVSKAKSEAAVASPALAAWRKAAEKARRELGITGFEPLKKGTAYYSLTKKYYTQDYNQLGSFPLTN